MHRFTYFLFVLSLTACAEEKKPDASQSLRTRPAVTAHAQNASALADCTLKLSPSALCFSFYWEKVPNENEEGSIIFKIYHPNALDQTVVMNSFPQNPEVLLWMPSMGHGSSLTKVDQIDTGTFRASKVYFVMPGAWEIHFQIKNKETVVDEVIIPVTY